MPHLRQFHFFLHNFTTIIIIIVYTLQISISIRIRPRPRGELPPQERLERLVVRVVEARQRRAVVLIFGWGWGRLSMQPRSGIPTD